MLHLAAALLSLAPAQPAPPYQCGPDCSQRGRYVLCQDTFDTNMTSAGGVQLTEFLEAGCATFQPPAASFQLTGFAALFGPGETLIGLLEVFVEDDTERPGADIFDTGVAIPDAVSAGFSGLLFGSVTSTVAFRMCLRQQLDDPVGTMLVRPLYFDGDGVQGRNWSYSPRTGWSNADQTYPSDLVLRAVVEYPDYRPWEPGGPCENMGAPDAGPRPDSGGGGDSGNIDDADGGNTGDPDGGVPIGGAPMITAISPDRGPNTQSTPVIVTGTHFENGLTLKIGSIAAENIDVAGPTTINAVVPADINAGAYDVIVQNPDGQAAILPKGYTVLDPNQTGNAADECGCTAAGKQNGPAVPLVLAGLLFLRLIRRNARRSASTR